MNINPSAILLEKTSDTEWIFKNSKKQIKLYEQLNNAEDLIDEGELDHALVKLEDLLTKIPECLEIYNDIFLCYLYKEEHERAFKYLKHTVNSIVSMLPEEFLTQPDQKLFWGFLENRPFLRLYVNLANEYLERRNFKDSTAMFKKVLDWNPHDNQGVRERILIGYFELGLHDEILKLCDKYPEDIMAGIVYAKPLVLFLQKKLTAANKDLLSAIQTLPKVANELVKSKHPIPQSMNPGYLTIGGDDEAYQYWLDFGKYWKRASGAITFVKQNLKMSANPTQENILI